MTLNRKWSEEKLKLKLILIPSKLFSLIYLILTTRRKNKVSDLDIASKPQGVQRLQFAMGTSKKYVKSISSLEGDE